MGRWGGRDSPYAAKDGGPGSGPQAGGGNNSDNDSKIKSINAEIEKIKANNQGDPNWAEREINRLKKARLRLLGGNPSESHVTAKVLR